MIHLHNDGSNSSSSICRGSISIPITSSSSSSSCSSNISRLVSQSVGLGSALVIMT